MLAIPDHHLVRLIGSGSYGEVWLARSALGTYRAVKIVYEKTFQHARPFEREFKGVKKFEPLSRLHEGLVDILQVGRNDDAGYFYCVMELADDAQAGQQIDPDRYSPRTLAHDIAKFKRLPGAECRRIGAQIASALGFLHAHGLIHRDVKPSNIIFVNGTPKLADIGLVVEMSEAKSYVGTEGFIPPEGPGTVQADIYSLGKVLYEISTGKDRHDYPELPTHLGDPAEKRELMVFNKVILRACRADPGQRYRSAKTMAVDLAELRANAGSNPAVRPRLKIAALTTGFIGLGIVAWLGLSGPPQPPHPPPAATRANPVPSPAGLVAWWRAEEDGRDAMGTNDGVLYGVGFEDGKVGRAFDFMPPRHRVLIADNDVFKLTNSLTIEGWIYVRNGDGYIFCRDDDRPGLDPYGIAAGPHEIVFEITSPLQEQVRLTAPIVYHQWKHFAATLDDASGDMKIFLDGRLAAATNTTVRPFAELEPDHHPGLAIGNLPFLTATMHFNGLVDELALYSRALSPEEIGSIYNAGAAGKAPPLTPRPELAPVSAPKPPAVPAPPGLVGWWPGEDNAKDVVNGNDGTLVNGASFAPGMVGRAFRFDGAKTKSFVKIPNTPALDVGNEVTVEFWMKADVNNPMNECCQGLVATDFYHVGISDGQTWKAGVDFCVSTNRGVSWAEITEINLGAPMISSDEWHHIAATYNGSDSRLYVDGQPWGKPTPCSGRISSMLPGSFLSIGSEDGRMTCDFCRGERYFKGLIDEVSIYNRALTAGEISAIFNAGSGGKLLNTAAR